MNPETRITLLKELENIKRTRAQISYPSAWVLLLVSIVWIAQIVYFTGNPGWSSALLNGLMIFPALALLLHSFYVIISHKSDRRMVLLISALLESKRSFSEMPENQNIQF